MRRFKQLCWLWCPILFFQVWVSCQTPKSSLCSKNNIEVPCYSSKEHALLCRVRVSQSHECTQLGSPHTFSNTTMIVGKELGDVNLDIYVYRSPKTHHTNINLTFSDIKWTDMTLKFEVKETDILTVTRCWYFTIHSSNEIASEITQPFTSLFWDCHWFNYTYEGRYFTMEYAATDGVKSELRQFHFRLPKSKTLGADQENSFELLVFLEQFQNFVIVSWRTPFNNLNITNFRVNLSDCGDTFNKCFYCHKSKQITLTSVEVISLQHELVIPHHSRCYIISVEPWLRQQNYWGAPSFTKAFYTTFSLWQMIFIILAALTSLFFLLMTFCSYYTRISRKEEPCLLVYHVSSKKHMDVLDHLVYFLRNTVKIRPILYAQTDIKKDGMEVEWWSNASRRAKIILVISSPKPTLAEEPSRASKMAPLQPFIDNIPRAQMFARELFKRKKSEENCKMLRILLPYCNEDEFPGDNEARLLPCLRLPEDLCLLIQTISKPPLFSFLSLPQCAHQYLFKTIDWRRLERAIQECENDRETKQIEESSDSTTTRFNHDSYERGSSCCSSLYNDLSDESGRIIQIQDLSFRKDDSSSSDLSSSEYCEETSLYSMKMHQTAIEK